MAKAKISIIGHFGEGKTLLNGQTIKTKILTQQLTKELGEEAVIRIDTHGGVKALFKIPFQILGALKRSENVMILPAQNGLRINVPLLTLFRPFFKGRKLHYVVIGGWVAKFIQDKKRLKRQLMSFDGIYVETNIMKKALEKQGFTNVFVVPNCKELTPLTPEQLVYAQAQPYKLCTFSRVMQEKGIEDAVEAVKAVNDRQGKTVYALDIYGQVDPGQTEWFDALQKTFPDCVRYGGCVAFDKSVETLKDYYALLFPTRFYTEGIPGTIIDAYAAGVPVVSARWESFEDLVDHEVTGLGYTFGSREALEEVLEKIALEKEQFDALKTACLEKSRHYTPAQAVKVLLKELG